MRAQRRGVSKFDGKRLKQAMTSKALSRSALATAAGVSIRVVAEYEQGKRTPAHRTLRRLAAAHSCEPGDPRSAGATTLRDLREDAGLGQAGTAEQAGMTRSAYGMLEQGRTRTLDRQVAELLAAAFGTSAEAVLAAHAQAVAAQPAHNPLLLEGRLLEQLAAHFNMTPDAPRALAFRLSNAPEGGLL
ncbi:helix-turn-helix domain-containing protein (plasmid) [Streptomyces cellulosae]|uniref:helix-turn-helix transcriptional regulator n=1 Tax=Streptomyces cellulosae TaxID=1968 RepID=UPI002F9084C3|nr:helix-turn-helix domain-containing protein [Streptomyces cellulosae]